MYHVIGDPIINFIVAVSPGVEKDCQTDKPREFDLSDSHTANTGSSISSIGEATTPSVNVQLWL